MVDWPPSTARIVQFFNTRSTTYDTSRMHRWLARCTVDQARLVAGMTVLDLGAGTGLAIRDAAARLNGQGNFIAVDIAGALLAVARAEAEGRFGLETIKADIRSVPLSAGVADVALCVAVLAYVDKPVDVFRECKRLLKADGQLIFQAFAADTMTAPRLLREAAAELGVQLTDPNAALGTPERCAQVLRRAGFQLTSIVVDAWQEPLPEAGTFWAAMAEGVMRDYLAGLPATLANALKEGLARKLVAPREHHDTDTFRALFVCARQD